MAFRRAHPRDVPSKNLLSAAVREEPKLSEGYGPRPGKVRTVGPALHGFGAFVGIDLRGVTNSSLLARVVNFVSVTYVPLTAES